MTYPKTLNELIEFFKKFPGIGEKTAERLAFSALKFDQEDLESFSNTIKNAKKILHSCKCCGTLTDKEICDICTDKSRDKTTLIVVEDSKEVFLFEKLGTYKAYYQVLGGLISPLDDIGPDDIKIKELIKRIENDKFSEVILAIKSSIEADTTSLYIKKILEDKNIKVTRIASGIPIGADMDYIDALTLESALNNRKEVGDNII